MPYFLDDLIVDIKDIILNEKIPNGSDKICYFVSKALMDQNFISENLPDGFETIVGEKGARLSGGQVQRIGIARAFYNNPDYLILDEATSNLDVRTENKFIKELDKIKTKITIIHVSHRNNVIKSADKIFVFDRGKIKIFHNFNDFKNSKFKNLIS